jgi:predicted permease
MKTVARLRSWFKAMTHRTQLDGEMQTELHFHIESYASDLVRNGLSREEAMRQARLELGAVATQQEKCRESLGLRLWDDLLADLQYGLRMLKKSPGFTTIAVVSLALGIGANTAIFTLAKEALLDMLSVPHPEQLRLLAADLGRKSAVHHSWGYYTEAPGGGQRATSFSYPIYRMLSRQNHSLEDLFAFKDLGNYGLPVAGQIVSGNYFQALGVDTRLGRPILPSDDAQPGGGAVAVISDGLWARAFGRSPAVIGKTIVLNLTPVMIVGVNPPSFTGAASVQTSPEVFVPFSLAPVLLPGKESLLEDKNLWWLSIMARAKPGVGDATANAALSVALDQAVRATMTVGKDDSMPRLALVPGSRGFNEAAEDLGMKIYILLALAGLTLLLACANIANLLLARSAGRQREVSVRMALGASRGRILRQVFTESLLLSLLGGAAGFSLGYLGRGLIPRLLTSSWQQPTYRGRFDWKIFAFTAAVSLTAGLLFGVAPAFQSTRANVNTGLKDGVAAATKRRKGLAGKAIVVFQVSLSMLLIIGAGLFVRTLMNLTRIDVGFRPEHVLLFGISPPQSRYPSPEDITVEHRIEEKLGGLPGVASATLSSVPLLSNNISDRNFNPNDQPKRANPDENSADVNEVGPDFLTTMSIPLLAGRQFNAQDTETAPKVAIVNQALARKFYPKENPIGKTFNDGHIRIIGICADAKYDSLREQTPPTFYLPYRQAKELGRVTYELRLRTSPEGVLPAIRNAVASIDKDLPLIDVRTQTEQIDAILSQERLFAALTGAFGVLALTLACIGIYGIMAYNVARRTNEIGIRMALGAQSGQVLRMVLSEASWLAVFGIGIGLGSAFWLTRFLQTLLYGLKPSDPATLIGAALLLLATAVGAGWLPAWRASKVQPMEALRHE